MFPVAPALPGGWGTGDLPSEEQQMENDDPLNPYPSGGWPLHTTCTGDWYSWFSSFWVWAPFIGHVCTPEDSKGAIFKYHQKRCRDAKRNKKATGTNKPTVY